jgi:hypothetical protein
MDARTPSICVVIVHGEELRAMLSGCTSIPFGGVLPQNSEASVKNPGSKQRLERRGAVRMHTMLHDTNLTSED